ncbi:class I SAM-dependent methyltransferase [Aureimonas glaciei]|uniref:O-methyltransferase n=1 Tax=Aureimonas glaciei TaxID=1776957 RepID=A0A917DCB0_9HYPH|nr:class I SAM-dependent methyltransferase [Aureimonas glaciei]GGD28197.1 O-methyltransferase [Aureimonas glaciei]
MTAEPHSAPSDAGHSRLMDAVYRRQRHIYDVTRKFYLLGRDRLIADLAPSPGDTVLEVGCGTGRNLILAARRYPQARLYGIDISEAMLATARANIAKAGLAGQITLARADATAFSPGNLFGFPAFDRVFISYAVSMIPDWQAAAAAAFGALGPGGSLHIVDFGQQEGLPPVARRLLQAWLRRFHVTPRANLGDVLATLAAGQDTRLDETRLHRGYAWLFAVRRS